MSRGAAPAEDGEPVIVISSSPSSADSGRAPTASTGGVRGVPRSRLRSAKKLTRKGEPVEMVKEEEKEEKEEEDKGDTEKEKEEEIENGIRVRVKGPSDVVFPMRRVKILMTECENCRPSRESVFLVNKAAELFLESFVADAYKKARVKSLTYKDLSSTVCAKRKYQFLSDYVPEKIRAEDALKARASLES